MGRMDIYSSLFSQNLKFSFPQIWEELEGMQLDLINFFTKIPKIYIYIQLFVFLKIV